jgi:hypothetical protein
LAVSYQLSAVSRKLTFNFQFKKVPLGTTVPRQVMKHAVRNPCKKSFETNQSAEGATEKYLCRAFSTFYIIPVMNARSSISNDHPLFNISLA